MITQTLNLAPADKKIYALRDTISCVESIPLIASSIMSKKIASGAQKIVLDVTVGKGAFMKNLEQAKKLAKEMIEIGKLAGRETVCILTNMDEPLGYAVGNILEVQEAVRSLRGEIPEDVKQVVLELGAYMMKLAEKGDDIENNKKILLENLNNQKAYNKFLEMVKRQKGDISYIEDLENFEKPKYIEPVYSDKKGYIKSIDAKEIGKISCELGAGRVKKEDDIDYTVGILLNKKVGQGIDENEILGYIYANDKEKLEKAVEDMRKTIKVTEEKVKHNKCIIKIMEKIE